MCQRDHISVPIVVFVPKVWKESEDLGRDPVDGSDAVLPGPNQFEDLESVLLENVELNKYNTHQLQSTRPFRLFVQPQSYLESSRLCMLEFQSP